MIAKAIYNSDAEIPGFTVGETDKIYARPSRLAVFAIES